MDNFRRRDNQQPRQPGSTDGFFAKRTPSNPGSESMSASNRARIGDFSQSADSGAAAWRFGSRDKQDHAARPRQPMRDASGSIRLDLPPDQSTHQKRRFNLRNIFQHKHMPRIRSVALVLVIAFGSYFITSAYLKTGQIFQGGGGAVALQDNVDPARLQGEGDGRVNILLLGKDDAADLTDTIIIASIDPIHDEAALLSIPRDLWVQPNAMGQMKINEVFANARNQALAQQLTGRQADIRAFRTLQDAITDVIGIPIHYYVTVDFDGFRRAIDTVGGVTLDVDQPVREVMLIDGERYVLDVGAGQEYFDGYRALAYVRSRKTSPRGDFDRSERQREILIGLKDKMLSSGTWSNPARVNALFNDFADNVKTSFAVDEIMRLYEIMTQIAGDGVTSLELVGEEPDNYIVTSSINNLSIQVPRAGMFEYGEIQSFVRNTLRDGYLRSEDATVLVMNGTEQLHYVDQIVEELESYGYNVTEPVDAPSQDYRETILVDMTRGEKKYTKRYLEQRMKTFASSSLPNGLTVDTLDADFVIIIGQNEATRR